MKSLWIFLLFLVLSLCAAAQTTNTHVPGVTLSGPLLDASVENHSDQALLAVNIAYTDIKGSIWRHQMEFVGLGLMPGTSQKLHTWSKRQSFNRPGAPATLASYAVTAVIFASGELRGDERGDATGGFVDNVRSHKPALKIWQSGIRAKLQQWIPDIMNWFAPVAAHAQGGFTNVSTWPYTYYNPPYYPSQWVYVCTDHVFGGNSNPCPPQFSMTPWQGVQAYCPSGGYWIGIQINVGIDDSAYPAVSNSSGTSANPSRLRNTGTCSDNLTGALEGWTYLNYCQGNPSNPIMYNDNTGSGDLCGLDVLGWYQM